jgi:hypothetical protein
MVWFDRLAGGPLGLSPQRSVTWLNALSWAPRSVRRSSTGLADPPCGVAKKNAGKVPANEPRGEQRTSPVPPVDHSASRRMPPWATPIWPVAPVRRLSAIASIRASSSSRHAVSTRRTSAPGSRTNSTR